MVVFFVLEFIIKLCDKTQKITFKTLKAKVKKYIYIYISKDERSIYLFIYFFQKLKSNSKVKKYFHDNKSLNFFSPSVSVFYIIYLL